MNNKIVMGISLIIGILLGFVAGAYMGALTAVNGCVSAASKLTNLDERVISMLIMKYQYRIVELDENSQKILQSKLDNYCKNGGNYASIYSDSWNQTLS